MSTQAFRPGVERLDERAVPAVLAGEEVNLLPLTAYVAASPERHDDGTPFRIDYAKPPGGPSPGAGFGLFPAGTTEFVSFQTLVVAKAGGALYYDFSNLATGSVRGFQPLDILLAETGGHSGVNPDLPLRDGKLVLELSGRISGWISDRAPDGAGSPAADFLLPPVDATVPPPAPQPNSPPNECCRYVVFAALRYEQDAESAEVTLEKLRQNKSGIPQARYTRMWRRLERSRDQARNALRAYLNEHPDCAAEAEEVLLLERGIGRIEAQLRGLKNRLRRELANTSDPLWVAKARMRFKTAWTRLEGTLGQLERLKGEAITALAC